MSDLTQTLPIPQRVVSLVPSLTESLFSLGLGHTLVGRTDYCLYPAEGVRGIPTVGGTKNPDIHKILALNPDWILANQEENTPRTVAALQAAGLPVWVSFPKTVAEAMDVLWALARRFQSGLAIQKLQVLEMSLDWAEEFTAQRETRPRYFCPIWQDTDSTHGIWWMTFNHDTYAHDLLTLLGGENCFAARQRRYPLAADLDAAVPAESAAPEETRDTRYPRVTPAEVVAAQPEIILLPSEPYAFGLADQTQVMTLLKATPAVQNGRVHLVDGSLLFWHGTRLALALKEFAGLFE
ncbi:MAG: helical backbone metal receptor [Anaerolineales bacterium]